MKAIDKIHVAILLFAACLSISACATSTSTSGRDFESAKVAQIVKGKTTTGEILAMFGTPQTKQPEADGGERWLYSYATATAHAQAVPFGGVQSKITGGHKKILNVLISKDKVVSNFTFDEGPIDPHETKTKQY
jgi:outer membrane protein assembly factor BamE (lipoprotein component of BamABCDE complex)